MNQSILKAYYQARYVLRIGQTQYPFRARQKSEVLEKLLNYYGSSRAVFITAFNPRSESLPIDINLIRHGRLKNRLASNKYKYSWISLFCHIDSPPEITHQRNIFFFV